jgi:hypothetical protein
VSRPRFEPGTSRIQGISVTASANFVGCRGMNIGSLDATMYGVDNISVKANGTGFWPEIPVLYRSTHVTQIQRSTVIHCTIYIQVHITESWRSWHSFSCTRNLMYLMKPIRTLRGKYSTLDHPVHRHYVLFLKLMSVVHLNTLNCLDLIAWSDRIIS